MFIDQIQFSQDLSSQMYFWEGYNNFIPYSGPDWGFNTSEECIKNAMEQFSLHNDFEKLIPYLSQFNMTVYVNQNNNDVKNCGWKYYYQNRYMMGVMSTPLDGDKLEDPIPSLISAMDVEIRKQKLKRLL